MPRSCPMVSLTWVTHEEQCRFVTNIVVFRMGFAVARAAETLPGEKNAMLGIVVRVMIACRCCVDRWEITITDMNE